MLQLIYTPGLLRGRRTSEGIVVAKDYSIDTVSSDSGELNADGNISIEAYPFIPLAARVDGCLHAMISPTLPIH